MSFIRNNFDVGVPLNELNLVLKHFNYSTIIIKEIQRRLREKVKRTVLSLLNDIGMNKIDIDNVSVYLI